MHRISISAASSSFHLFSLLSSPLDVFTLNSAPICAETPTMSKIYEIDPEADTLVVVRPLAAFAVWPGHAAPATAAPSKTADVRIKASSKHLSLASPRLRDLLAQKTATASSVSVASSFSGLGISDVSGTPPASSVSLFAPNPKSPKAQSPAAFGGGGLASPPATPTKSLWRRDAPASPTLSVASTATSVVSTALIDEADGRIHLELDGVDADAVKTVLNIVHGRAGKDRVPATQSLDALARIAVVVDRFRLQDAVEVYAERWVDALYRRGIPTPTTAAARRDLVLWIYVAYVFGRSAIFQEATKVAATQLTGALPVAVLAQASNLPLRAKIAADIEAQRQEAIGASLAVLAAAVDTLVGSDAADDDAFLGRLMRTLHKSKLYWPQPAAPYEGVSVAAISRAVRGVGTGSRLSLTPQLDRIRAGVTGLDLKSELGYSLY